VSSHLTTFFSFSFNVSNVSHIFIQNIEKAHKYKVVFFVKASGSIDLDVSFVGSDNTKLASNSIRYIYGVMINN